jgi:HSP20 family protein
MFIERTDPVATEFDRITQRLFGGTETAGLAMDVVRGPEGLVVRVDVPGVAADDLTLTLDDGVLTIGAERRATYGEDEKVLLHERFDGTLTRRLRVPDWVDGSRVSADHADGVLTVHLPLAERARPRTIEVQSSGQASRQIDAA